MDDNQTAIDERPDPQAPIAPTEPVDAAQVEIDVYGKKMKISDMLQFADSNCTRCWGRGIARFNGKHRMCRCAERNIVRQFGSRADRRKYGLATPAEKKEDEAEQLSASTVTKTARLREEAAKHKQIIDQLMSADQDELKDLDFDSEVVARSRKETVELIEMNRKAIEANETDIAEARELIARRMANTAVRSEAIETLAASVIGCDNQRRAIDEKRNQILAKNKPLLDAEIKRLEKVQRRLSLHLARHPGPAMSDETDPGPPAAL